MRKKIIFLYLILSGMMINAQSFNRETATMVLIFNDAEKINVYQSWRKDKIIDQLYNDTVNEDYFTIRIIKSKNNLYKVKATSIVHPSIKGWIDLINIGIYTRPRDFKLHLYYKPNYKAPGTIIKEEDGRLVKVTAISSNWLKIELDIKNETHEYWLPKEHQCSNPYTTCN